MNRGIATSNKCLTSIYRNKKLLVTRASLLGARKLLGARWHIGHPNVRGHERKKSGFWHIGHSARFFKTSSASDLQQACNEVIQIAKHVPPISNTLPKSDTLFTNWHKWGGSKTKSFAKQMENNNFDLS